MSCRQRGKLEMTGVNLLICAFNLTIVRAGQCRERKRKKNGEREREREMVSDFPILHKVIISLQVEKRRDEWVENVLYKKN